MGTSQLGGVVYGNTNLNQNADIILNEVGSTNRSVLKGALEVFGKNAAVVQLCSHNNHYLVLRLGLVWLVASLLA
jgi:filamentous hemagglutinin family protein